MAIDIYFDNIPLCGRDGVAANAIVMAELGRKLIICLPGTDQHNMALSLRRANTVKDDLVRNGVPAGSMVVVARGESQPLVPTADGLRGPQNRRVESVLN